LTILIGVLPLVRFYLLRHRKRTTSFLISDIFYALGSIVSCYDVAFLAVTMAAEVDIRKTAKSEEEVAERFYTPGRLKLLLASGIGYAFELWFIKFAFLAFYWALFVNVPTPRRITLKIVVVVMPILAITAIVTQMTACIPIWNPEANCFAVFITYVAAVTNTCHIATDIMLLALPLQLLSTLKLTRPDKVAVALIFVMGSLSMVATIARLSVLLAKGILSSSSNATIPATDLVSLLSALELTAGIFAFALPAMRPMFLWILGVGVISRIRSALSSQTHSRSERSLHVDQHNESRKTLKLDAAITGASQDSEHGIELQDNYNLSASSHHV